MIPTRTMRRNHKGTELFSTVSPQSGTELVGTSVPKTSKTVETAPSPCRTPLDARCRISLAFEIVRPRHKRPVCLGPASRLRSGQGRLGESPSMEGFLPVLIMIALGVAFAGGSIAASQFLGPRKPTPEKLAPYECGMPAVGDARERMSVKFYLVAMIFLLFDIEVAFLYPWAVAFRDLGRSGFWQLV